MRSFEQHLTELRARGVEIAAISVDTPEQSRNLCRQRGYTFPFLSDPGAEVIRRYGVLHPRGGDDGRDIARPAEFLVDSTGIVRWANLTDSILRRARPDEVLAALDRMPGSSAIE